MARRSRFSAALGAVSALFALACRDVASPVAPPVDKPSHAASVVPAARLTFDTVNAGNAHTCGVTVAGAAYCWGLNNSGQLGNGTMTESFVPVAASGTIIFTTVSAGGAHTCALTGSGAAYCWGNNSSGQLGIGTSTGPETCAFGAPCSTTPLPVVGGLAFIAISVGGNHTCARTSGGMAYCWGDNGFGQLGIGTTSAGSVPTAVSGGLTFASLSAGGNHTCGATPAGAAYCWGLNLSGQLGVGTSTGPALCAGSPCSTLPVAVTGGLAFGTVSAGQDHTCGVTRGPAAYCWGDNQVGQLGAGTSTGPELCSFGTACSTQPVAVVRASNVAAISAGGRHTCALAPVGAAFCWGWNLDGQLGTGRRAPDFCDPGGGPTPCSPRPVPVVGRLTFAGVSAGFSHTCGVTPAGVAYCWGFNLSGQLGIGENVPSWPRPVQVAAP